MSFRIIPVTLACVMTPVAFAQSFSGMGDLAGGDVSSYASHVSCNGEIVSGTSHTAGGYRGGMWTAGTGLVMLSGAPANMTESQAYGVSGVGTTIVGRMMYSATTGASFRWTQSQGMVAMPATPWPDNMATLALCTSFDGSVVSGTTYDTNTGLTTAYRWTSGSGYTKVPLLANAVGGTGYGLSGNGTWVVGYCSMPGGSEQRAFRWSAGTGTQYLGDLPGDLLYSSASAASHDGSVVVGGSYGSTGEQPFRWTAGGGMVGLGNFASPVPNGSASACSGDGSVIVGHSRLGNDYEAFVWDAVNGMRSVRSVLQSKGVIVPAGWKLTYAQDVSYDGTVIVGQGTNPQGNIEGWVARLRASCPADLNGDGVVNTADLTIMLGNFGKSVVPLLGGDLDGSGFVNTPDLTQFLAKFGTAC